MSQDFLLAYGDEARKEALKGGTEYIKLKDGESVRGFFPTTKYVMILEHNDFEKKINTHMCRDPHHRKDCLSCQHGVKRVKTFVIPFYNVDKKVVQLWKISQDENSKKKNKHMTVVERFFEQYEGAVENTPVTLSRSGTKAETSYQIMPIPPNQAAKQKDLFVLPDDIVIDKEFFAFHLTPPDEAFQRKLLKLDNEEESIEPIEGEGDERLF